MRFVVYGAGAVGGVMGGRLHLAGHEVVLIARGAHHDAIKERGLLVETPESGDRVRVPVVRHPSELEFRPDDAIVLGMKTQDTAAALEALSAVAPPSVSIVCAQNGVENERLALRRFAKVYAMCVVIPAAHLEPGVVQAFSAPTHGVLDLGRYPEGTDATAEALAEALGKSGFESTARPDIMRFKYGKLLTNLVNAAEVVCGRGAEAAEVVAAARDEGRAVLEAAGIPFSETGMEAYPAVTIRPTVSAGRWPGSSSLQSVRRGTGTIEADYLNGEIALLGRTLGVPTPVNAALQRLAGLVTREGRELGSFSPADVLAAG
ncbi:MAG: 2-dehydropantoate 2-reductase [Streptosporangiales bacterium]|nr:2-dehydropantoate 2-reductase [Streptosporangiales bacterium]